MISIIVPVYNAEKYLNRCISSLLNQTYHNLEIILVNDGSTDNSKKICENAAKKDSRVKVINSVNEGVSLARNKGLKRASGDYVSFVDSDDYVEPGYIEKMLLTLKKKKVDIVYCSAIVENINGVFIQREYEKNKLIKIQNYDWNSSEAHCVVRGALIPKWVVSDLKFDKKLFVGEDTYFFAQCIKKVKYVYCIKNPLYHYVIYDKSVSHGNSINRLVTEIYAWQKIAHLFNNNDSAKVACAMRCKKMLLENQKNKVFKNLYYEDIAKIYKNYFVIVIKYFLARKKIDSAIKNCIFIILIDVNFRY